MKANRLNGEYCQSCASILDDVQRHHRRVIVLDSQCAAVFSQSGDAARLDEIQKALDPEIAAQSRHVAPGLEHYEDMKRGEKVKETIGADSHGGSARPARKKVHR